jgi:hypothetical protein
MGIELASAGSERELPDAIHLAAALGPKNILSIPSTQSSRTSVPGARTKVEGSSLSVI